MALIHKSASPNGLALSIINARAAQPFCTSWKGLFPSVGSKVTCAQGRQGATMIVMSSKHPS